MNFINCLNLLPGVECFVCLQVEDWLLELFSHCSSSKVRILSVPNVENNSSNVFFKGKAWPVVFGMGVGTGMGVSNCQHRLNMPFLLKAERLQVNHHAEH